MQRSFPASINHVQRIECVHFSSAFLEKFYFQKENSLDMLCKSRAWVEKHNINNNRVHQEFPSAGVKNLEAAGRRKIRYCPELKKHVCIQLYLVVYQGHVSCVTNCGDRSNVQYPLQMKIKLGYTFSKQKCVFKALKFARKPQSRPCETNP